MERKCLLPILLWYARVRSECTPCASSELVHFRNRIGAKGVELIFQESIRINNEDNDGHHHETAFY